MTERSRKASAAACSSSEKLTRAANILSRDLDKSDGIPVPMFDDEDSLITSIDATIERSKVH